MNLEDAARRLVSRIAVLRRPCDLDLLVFFARHPRTLLSNEQLAVFLGYGVADIAASLELLLSAGFLTRTPNARHAARMYVLTVNGPGGGWLPELLKVASTREGRLAMICAVRRGSSTGTGDPVARVEGDAHIRQSRPFLRAAKGGRR